MGLQKNIVCDIMKITKNNGANMDNRILNITNGEVFNEYFISRFGGDAIPFCEAMMDGKTVMNIFSEEFIELRSFELNVSVDLYKSKMHVCKELKNDYDKLKLWFGKDTFCQMNLLTLLAYLEQIGYHGEVVLNYIDDETFDVIESNIQVDLGRYLKLYESILISKSAPIEVGVLCLNSVELYFDYHSTNGKLAEIVRNNSTMERMDLICLLLNNSKEYGLSDIQAKKLIEKYRN